MPHRPVPFSHRPVLWEILLALTALLLAAGAGAAGWSWWNGTATLLQRIAGIFCAFCVLCIVYGRFLEPRRITLTRYRLPLGGPEALRIAIVSDLHVGSHKRTPFIRSLVRRLRALQPDMILLVGDFLDDDASSIDHLAPLADLQAPHGVFAVLGNHDTGRYVDMRGRPFRGADRGDEVEHFLARRGITVLRNAVTQAGGITIAGLNELWSVTPEELRSVLLQIDPASPSILLSHQPDLIHWDDHVQRATLIISGHTHGGQIRLPLLGPILPIPSALGRRFSRGLFPVGERTTLLITHGVGEALLRARFCAPPEIVLVETL